MSYVVDNNFLKKLEATKQKKLIPLLEVTLKEYTPKECKIMSQENLNKFLLLCYNNAQAHGTQNFGELKAFTFLTYHLGIAFYKDPLYPKIVNIFESTSPIDVKLDRAINYFLKELYIYKKEQLQKYQTALNKLEKVAFEEIPNPLSTELMAKYLYTAYPQRVKSLGGVDHLAKLMPQYHETLQTQGLNTPLGKFVFYMIWMFLGSSFLEDPRYAWLQKEFYSDAPNPKKKSYGFLRVMRKRLRKEKKELTKILNTSDDTVVFGDLLGMLSSSELDEESQNIVDEVQENFNEFNENKLRKECS